MVEIWGGGGGGISLDMYGNTGGGGGGGGYGKQVFNVSPGSGHAVVVGLGGSHDSPGGDSSFDGIIAHGGLYTIFGGIGGDCNATLNITGGDGVPIVYAEYRGGTGGAASCGGLGGTGGFTYVQGLQGYDMPAGGGSVPGGGGGGSNGSMPPGYGAHGRVVVYY